MNALRGNTYLERLLDLGSLRVRDGCFQPLVTALPENRGLTHLRLTTCTADDRCWDKLMGATYKVQQVFRESTAGTYIRYLVPVRSGSHCVPSLVISLSILFCSAMLIMPAV
jgi:hypothetical protein